MEQWQEPPFKRNLMERIKMYRYIADLHIGCANSFEHRTLEHDEILVKNWNSVVNNNDTTFILGDIGRCGSNKDNEYLCSVISKLKSRKILVVGNHDESGLKDYRVKQLFESVVNYFELTDNHKGINQKLVLSHYPIFSWNGCYKDVVLLYGHTHGNFDDIIYQESLEKLRYKVRELNKDDKHVKKFKSLPYAYNVGAMMDWINYCPRTWEEIKDRIFLRKVEG